MGTFSLPPPSNLVEVATVETYLPPLIPLRLVKIVMLVTKWLRKWERYHSNSFVTSESDELGGIPPVPSQQEENPPVPTTKGVHSTIYSVLPPSSLVASFDWNQLERSRLPSNVPFRIIVQVHKMIVSGNIIDEGALVSILSSISWEALGSPLLIPVT